MKNRIIILIGLLLLCSVAANTNIMKIGEGLTFLGDIIGNQTCSSTDKFNNFSNGIFSCTADIDTDTTCNATGTCSAGGVAYMEYPNLGNFNVSNNLTARRMIITTEGTDDPTLTFKTTNTPNEVTVSIDENAGNDIIDISGLTSGVNTFVRLNALDGRVSTIFLCGGSDCATLSHAANDNFIIDVNVQDANMLLRVDDGGVTKTITWTGSTDIWDFNGTSVIGDAAWVNQDDIDGITLKENGVDIRDILLQSQVNDTLQAFYLYPNGTNPPTSNHLVNKEYVDQSISGLNFDFFLNNDTSDITGYFNMTDTDLNDSISTVTSGTFGISTGNNIANFSTQVGFPEFSKLISGVMEGHIHASRTGTRTAVIYWQLYVRNSTGSETLLTTSESSDELTGSTQEFDLHASLLEDQEFDLGDRLVMKWFTDVSGGGSNIAVTLTFEGEEDSRLSVRTESQAFNDIFVRRNDWTTHNDYNAACAAGQAVTNIDDVNTCEDFVDVSGDTMTGNITYATGQGTNWDDGGSITSNSTGSLILTGNGGSFIVID